MFGYVKIFKPQLRICEYDTYKAVYCGLCKAIGREYGILPRMTLSYDFAFLTLLGLSLDPSCKVTARQCRCIAHPLKKRPCVFSDEGFDYPAAAAQILIYHKLRDDIADRGAAKKIFAMMMLALMKKGYTKAKDQYPELAGNIEAQMKIQLRAERRGVSGIDEAAQPSAKMMEHIAENLSDDERQKRILRRFGYCIGRYVYLCDAADDLTRDIKSGSFNPLIQELGITGEVTEKDFTAVRRFITQSVNLTLSELADCYVLLDTGRYRPIIDNIIYLGLKASCAAVLMRNYSPGNNGDKKNDVTTERKKL